jgi:hypothetical protein
MNLVELLQRYAGKSLHPTGAMPTPPQTPVLSLLKPAHARQPDASMPPMNNHGGRHQLANDPLAAARSEARIEHESEPWAQLIASCNEVAGSPPLPLTWQEQIAKWPEEWRDRWDERAAIMEFEGDLPREEAERLAFELQRDDSFLPKDRAVA